MRYFAKWDCECPFYSREYEKNIYCDAITDNKEDVLKFDSELSKLDFINKYCIHKCPEGCTRYKVLMEKYKEK